MHDGLGRILVLRYGILLLQVRGVDLQKLGYPSLHICNCVKKAGLKISPLYVGELLLRKNLSPFVSFIL